MLRQKAIRMVAAAVVAACSFACTSTTDGTFYSSFKTIDGPGWLKEQPLKFALPDSLPVSVGDLEISVRHDNYYPYRNLWLRTDYVAHGRVVESYLVNVELADKFGNWYGSGLGKMFQCRSVVRKDVAVGKYDEVVVWHYMRCDTVPDVYDIGVSLKNVDNR